jgi:cytochrome c biogenesis protein CcmG/thiol:disulfide interchange protein DsbE
VSAGRGRTALTISALIGLVIAALIVLLATRDPATERASQTPLLGKLAPATAGTTIDGSKVSLDDYRGRFVVVNFFGSWCTPCQLEHRELKAFDAEHREKGDAALIAVTFDDKAKDARAFFAERGGSWPVIDDPENSIGVAYGIAQVPESWIIGPDGTVLERFAGEVSQSDLDRAIAHWSGAEQ